MKFIFQHKYKILVALAIGFSIWYYQCLPDHLFDDPVSLVIKDKNGELLSAHVAKDEQWRFPETSVSNEKFCKALIAFEDKRFYNHKGVDIWAISRAIKINFQNKRIVSGGSTLSMQLVRMSRKNPKRTYIEKLLELFRATRLELSHSKEEILNLYASHAPFGGNVVGIDAASWKYFGKDQKELGWSEAATLAVLPNAPSLIHLGRNRDALRKKRNRVLDKLYELGELDSISCVLAKLEPLPQKPVRIPNKAPHLMNRFLNDGIEGQITTSVDAELQYRVTDLLQKHSNRLQSIAVYNASAIVVNAKTGKVISYVGNVKDVKKQYENDVNMIHAHRSSGSILKPFLYAEALDKGIILPQSLLKDIPVDFYGYRPKNFDEKFDGVVPANHMITRSLNIPSVNLLNRYGVNTFLTDLNSYGFSSFTETGDHYGLSLILGGAEVTLWDLAKVYTGMTQKLNGTSSTFSISPKDTTENKFLDELPGKSAIWHTFDAMTNVTRPGEEKAWKSFGETNKIAWKTGTSFGGRDAWTVGCTPEYVVAVWAGNTDGEGRPNLSGVGSASPILFDIFNILSSNYEWFTYPESNSYEVKVCSQSGMKANSSCRHTQMQNVPRKGRNSKPCNYCRMVGLDSSKNFVVDGTTYTMMDRKEQSFFILDPLEAFYYKEKHSDYKQLPPSISSSGKVTAVYPKNNATIYLPKVEKDKRSSLVAKMTSTEKNDLLYWTLDDEFLGTTTDKHEQSINATIGEHILVVVNGIGKRETIHFEVVN